MKQHLGKYKMFLAGLTIGMVSILSVGYDHYFEVSKNLEIFSTLFKELDVYYVDEIKPGELTQTGIDAMLQSLDPYTNFIPESEMEDHRLSTTGQYGGIGAVVSKRNDYIVITEPYEGYPAQKAGLMAGDKLLEVNGQSVKGKSTDDVVKLLRGAPNSTVQIVVERQNKKMDFNVNREEIKIKNVPYYGIVEGNIGYIKLKGFTNNAGNDVKDALTSLKQQANLEGVILDLRGNPGGLLREAINVVNVFVERNQLVVSTKGKVDEWNKTYKTLNPAVDLNIPLVVLVNRSSASASEIVSGTIQDLDRGVVIGQRTFGKGLVQSTRPLVYNTQLKVTTSKYYIPSGRCIQALDYSKKNADGSAGTIADSLRNAFKTKIGRIVYDGGGVYPDIQLKPRKYSNVLRTLLSKNLIFDFATQYRYQHASISKASDFRFTDNEYDQFLEFLKDKSYEYTTESEKLLEEFKTTAQKEKYFESIEQEYNILVQKKQQSKNTDVIKFKDEIISFLVDEIVSRYYYQQGRIEASLVTDQDVREAISVLRDKKRYDSILSSTFVIKGTDEEVKEEDILLEEE
ncbi:MAG: S41 family peptidase [Candidatus Competibacteraceae bacterium]|nr:S41 family peptidase [Candidatus Competibacteraceae bacterium]